MSKQKVPVVGTDNSQRTPDEDFQRALATGRHFRMNGYRSQVAVPKVTTGVYGRLAVADVKGTGERLEVEIAQR